ncbi:MAG: hypothetical protein P0Y60_14500 [Candidatus Microbacterium colombiense]|nr:MAG: hypothetical protein P0Y60_14500 [Microbacterium sp.]
MSTQHIATAGFVKVSIGSPSGNRVAQLIQRGGVIPGGVDEEQLDRLVGRGLVEAIDVEEVEEEEELDEGVYKGVSVKDLKADLAGRNEGREGDAVITPVEPGHRPQIIAALLADDSK